MHPLSARNLLIVSLTVPLLKTKVFAVQRSSLASFKQRLTDLIDPLLGRISELLDLKK